MLKITRNVYSFINSAKKTKMKIGPLKHPNGELETDASEQAEMLNNFFSSVFTNSKNRVPEVEQKDVPETCSIKVKEEEVREALGVIKEGSAPGPDGIATKVII